MPGSDVRQVHALAIALVEERVAALEQCGVHDGQIPAFLVVELVEGEHVAHRGHMNLERPACRGRHIGDPAVVAHNDALPGLDFGVHEILEQVAAGLLMVGFGLLEFGFHLRCDERIAVDLAVRVRQGDADFLAVVLEREDLLDTLHLGDFGGTERPCFHDGAQAGDRQVRRQAVFIRVEADHFAAACSELLLPQRVTVDVFHVAGTARHAHHRRETVLEHDHVVVGVRHFTILVRIARLARGQRIAFGRRARTGGDRTVHTCGRHRNPIAGQWVATHFGSRIRHFLAGGVELVGETVRKLARIFQFASLDAGDVFRIVIEIEEVAAIGKRGRRDTDMLLRIFSRSVVDEITHVIIHLPEPARPGVPERAL